MQIFLTILRQITSEKLVFGLGFGQEKKKNSFYMQTNNLVCSPVRKKNQQTLVGDLLEENNNQKREFGKEKNKRNVTSLSSP